MQFSTLFTYFEGKDSDTSLQQIVDILSCTPRNARMVLHKMADEGWIRWQPAVGRGKQSRLCFHRTESDLQMKRVRKWVRLGKLDAALEELNHDAAKLARLIQEQLGISTQEGRQIIRLPYYRSFPCLNPRKPLRRSEQHLVRQIFNGLTKINEENEVVEPDLAHHWEMLTPFHWRFYLRPSVYFHDARLLTVDDVIWSIQQIQHHPYFSHIDHLDSPFTNVIDIWLETPDQGLPDTLAHSMAFIQSKKDANLKNNDRLPIGTGPYRVDENNEQHLVLKAHEQFFGLRALTDQIEIWVLDSAAMCYLQPTASLDPSVLETRQHQIEKGKNGRVALDEGCHYLLLNRISGVAEQNDWATYLSQRLSPIHLLPHLAEKDIGEYKLTNAYGLVPGWLHTSNKMQPIRPPAKKRLRLVYQQNNPLFPLIAEAIGALLEGDGIQLKIDVLPYESILAPKNFKQIDICLCGMSLGTKRSDALLHWIMTHSHFSAAMPKNEYRDIQQAMMDWRTSSAEQFDAESIGRQLVNKNQIIPLFHIWLGVVDAKDLEDVSSNNVGWFDFKSIWKKPQLNIKSF